MSPELFRRADANDVWELMRLHQICSADPAREAAMVNHHRVRDAIVNGADFWALAEWPSDGPDRGLRAAVFVMEEPEQRLAKIHRMYVHPEERDSENTTVELLRWLVADLEKRGTVDVLYTTTGKLSQSQVDLTLQLGFKMLGIFPNAMSADNTKMNAIAGYFFGDTLKKKRAGGHKVHPVIKSFYDIVRKQCGMENLEIREPGENVRQDLEKVRDLELIEAPKFVATRFDRLNEKKFLSVSFYPFQTPNALVTGPNQELEVFLTIVPEIRFAMVIGERMDRPVDPVALYVAVAELLRSRGVTYVEVINDAADVVGTELLLEAGFLPCVYFPALKRHGDSRRDYVVFGRAFEKNVLRPESLNEYLQEFWEEYKALESDGLEL
ncbi:MAG TPA: hypothetical protein VL588_05855 [Bdellovibrionota bacterium]|nr:hypothetical protein [Bdellovibrionota bacterium]